MSSNGLGYLCLLLWCVISAISRVYASNLLQRINPFTLCFYIFLIAMIFFLMLNIHRLKPLWKKILLHKKDVFYFNLTTFGGWFFIIYPLKYIEPSLVVALNVTLAPIFTFLILPFLYHYEPSKSSKFLCVGFLLLFIYMSIIILLDFSSMLVSSYPYTILSILFIGIGAFSLSLNNIYAKRLSDQGFKPIENVAVRFFMLVFLSAVIAVLDYQTLLLPKAQMKSVFFVSFLYAIIPLYLIQISIRELKPLPLATGLAIMPLTTFLIQSFSHRFHSSYWTILALILAFALSFMSLTLNPQKSKN